MPEASKPQIPTIDMGGEVGSWMHDHITLQLTTGFDLELPVLNAASDLSTRFYEKSCADNEATLEATVDDRALSLHLAFARASIAEDKSPTFDPAAVDNSLYDQGVAACQFA